MPKSHGSMVRSGWRALQISSMLVLVIFLIEFIDVGLRLHLDRFGILPRTRIGLSGIILSPFLHYNGAHLLANAASLLVLLILLFWDAAYKPWETLFVIWILSGLGTWIIGRPALHIGASGVIYGLVAYLIASAYWMKSWRAAWV